MKKTVQAIGFLMLAIPITYADSVSEHVEASLESWEPNSVLYKDGTLTVLAKERRITDQIYKAMIGGICMGMVTRPDSLSGISEIRILNQFGRQGYVFEGGESDCRKINEMPMIRTKIHILGMTHMHTN